MILDSFSQLAASFAPTATGNNIQTASVLDLLALNDPGPGSDVGFLIQVMTAVTSAGSATVDFQILGNATDPNFGSGNVVLFDNGAVAKASLVAGYRVAGVLPRQVISAAYEAKGSFIRYLALNVNIGTAVLTAGAFSCWLLNGNAQQTNLSYAAGFTV